MSMIDYQKALKMGQTEYRMCVSRGKYPYLNVLEEITSHVEIESEQPIGVVRVPTSHIVGTNARSRGTAFARNFMPLLEANSEFAGKWSVLCDAQLEEGIRDPIKCYEYLNRFYVIEGNKRVSVMKYFDAVDMEADVIRIIPRYNSEDKNIRLYYEFLDFYKICGVNYIWFTREGDFRKLLKILNMTEPWSKDQQKDFFSAYTRFDKAYTEIGGKGLKRIATGDAFMKYLEVYGYDNLQKILHAELTSNVRQLWDEFVVMNTPDPIGLVETPNTGTEEKPIVKPKLISKFLGAPDPTRHMKIGFVHDKDGETSSWTYGHELGRMHLETRFAGQIETIAISNVYDRPEGPQAVMEKLIEDGCTVLFTTTPRLAKDSLAIAVKHPKIKVLNCSINSSSSHMRSYYGRLYEPKFICGMVAGMLTKTDRIGYVADYPVAGMIANINAFARGARMTNPDAKICLVWSAVKNRDSERPLRDFGVDMISNQDMITPAFATREFGLYRIMDDHSLRNVCMPVWNWGKFYEKIINTILHDAWNKEDTEDEEGLKAINYWWGMASGVTDIMYTKTLPKDTIRMIEFMKKVIRTGEFDPFYGYIEDQHGNVRSPEDGYLPTRERVNMDWLMDNVIGTIPETWEFEDEAQPLIAESDMTLKVPEKVPLENPEDL